MQQLPALTPRQIVKTLKTLGFIEERRTDHRHMAHPDRERSYVKIPNDHGSTYSPSSFLFKSLLRNASVTKAEFTRAFFDG